MAMTLGRTETARLQNKSGGSLAHGDVVVVDISNAYGIGVVNILKYIGSRIGVVIEVSGIADNGWGIIAFSGFVSKINLNGSAAIGDWVTTSTTNKLGQPHTGTPPLGAFAQTLEAGTSPAALLLGHQVIVDGGGVFFAPTGLTGATEASRWVGSTVLGPPVTGTFNVNDWVIDQTGVVWFCTAGGSPGTWLSNAGSGVTTSGKLPLDNLTLHPTHGDHFDESSLNSRWTRYNQTSEFEGYKIRDGSHFRAALWGSPVSRQYHQTAPTGDFEVQMKLLILGPSQQVLGPMIIDASGNGVLASFNQTDNIFVLWKLSAYAYNGNIGTVTERNVGAQSGTHGETPMWFAVRKVGTTYSARFSVDGISWSSYLTGSSPQTFTVDRIGFGRALNTNTNWIDVDWFNVVLGT